jgi:hypothetical protein
MTAPRVTCLCEILIHANQGNKGDMAALIDPTLGGCLLLYVF